MKNAKTWTSLALALSAAFGAARVSAETETVDGVRWKYVVWGGEAWLGSDPDSSYGSLAVPSSTAGDLDIPWTLGGYTVGGIGLEAFKSCKKVTGVTIPDSVTDIGNGAFSFCNGIEYVDFGTGVERIGDKAFHRCIALTSVQIDGIGWTTIGEEAFSHCDALKTVDIGDGVVSIGVRAFSYCKELERVDVGGVQTIENHAFSSCEGLKTATVEGNGQTTVGEYAFGSCDALETVEFGAGVQTVDTHVLSLCAGLKSVTIEGNGRATIKESACRRRTTLERVEIGSGVETIEDYAFAGCDGLRTLVIEGNGRTTIGEHAFSHSVGDDKPPAETIEIGDGVVSIGNSAFAYSRGVENLEIGRGVREIGELAFANCSKLTSLTIPDNVTSIGFKMCKNCTGLKWVKIGAGVQNVGGSVFYGCSSLKTAYVPASWKGTSKLKSLKLPKGCTVVYGGGVARQTVRFEANGGWCGTAEKEYTAGKAYGSLPTATWAGHAFLGWWTEEDGGTQVTASSRVESAAALTLYAHWTTEQTVTFNGNGGASEAGSKGCAIGEAYRDLPGASRAGYAFNGWWTAKTGGTKVSAGETRVTEAASRTLYARWTTTQTVSFDGNGGTCKTKSKKYTIGKAYGSLPTASRAGGYRFAGWGTEPEGGETVGTGDRATEAAKRTLYAQWGADRQRVRFEANGGRCETEEGEWRIGGKYEGLPEARREGYVFQGWWTAAAGGSRVGAESTVTGEGRRTLHAQWLLEDREYAAWVRGLGKAEGEFEPKEDADGDGATNWEEYVADTDPLDAGDLLAAKLRWEEGRPVVDAPAVDGRRRGIVEGKRELTDAEWEDVTGVEDREGAGWRFFRVGVGLESDE